MQKLQDVFNRIQAIKRERRNVQILYKDALANLREYQQTEEDLKKLKARKKQLEEQTKAELGNQYSKYESLKKELELDNELLTDIAISTLMKGETVQIEDEDKNPYEPVFTVRFKKTNVVDQKMQ